MFHLSLLRSVRPFVFGNRSVWRKSAFVGNKFPWKRSFSKPSCSHSMACERENLIQTGDLSAGTKWIKKTTIRLGTFNLLAPCYKTIEPRYEIIYCVCVCVQIVPIIAFAFGLSSSLHALILHSTWMPLFAFILCACYCLFDSRHLRAD